MKKMIKDIRTVAALLMASATFAACSSDDNIIEEQPVQPTEQVYTMTVNAQKGGDAADSRATTRALSLSGSTLNATWTAGDEVEVWTSDGTTTKYGTLTAETSGASTTLKGTLTTLPTSGEALLLKYLSPAYATQDGTLTGSATSIDRVCDYATATDADFVNRQAIVKFTLKDKADGTTALSVSKLFVTASGTTCTVTPSSATSELYVAVPGINNGRVTLTALSGGIYYDYLKTGVTFAQSQYYAISASLTEVKSISNASTASFGRVVAADGKMYASVESATNAGTTPLAVIAQVDELFMYNEYMAIAIDEGWQMNWNDAKNYIDNKTAVSGADWLFPTLDEWREMFKANGGNQNSWTGLNTLFTKAAGRGLISGREYWTSTDDVPNGNKCTIILSTNNGSAYWVGDMDTSYLRYVRAFLFWHG